MFVWFVYARKLQRTTAQSHAAILSCDIVAQQSCRCDIGLRRSTTYLLTYLNFCVSSVRCRFQTWIRRRTDAGVGSMEILTFGVVHTGTWQTLVDIWAQRNVSSYSHALLSDSHFHIVAGSTLGRSAFRQQPWQVVHRDVPLSPSSIIWYRSRGGDAMRLGR